MKHRIIMGLIALTMLLASPVAVLARQQEEAPEIVDARLEGFAKNVTLSGSVALIWFAFLVLAFIALVVLFKDAKRTHLD